MALSEPGARTTRPSDATRPELLLLGALTLLALALRTWRLGSLPPGLHVDEAFNLLDARAVVGGWRPVFLPANAGREVLYTYLQAPLLALLGESRPTMRLASALAGTAAVPAAWLAARALLGTSGLPARRVRRTALATAGLVATLYWMIHFSRFGIRAILFAPLVCLVVWAWWRAIHTPSQGWTLTLAGLLGLAVYAHPAGRALAALPALDAAYRYARHRDTRPARVLAAALAGAAVVALPVILFWLRHPGMFLGHAGEVSILGHGPGAVVGNAVRVAGMFHVAGDPAAWRNLSGRPAFDPVVGLLFLAGLALTARSARRADDGAALVLAWVAVLAVPSIVTDAAPNFSRSIGLVPAACLLAARGLDAAATAVARVGAGPSGGEAQRARVDAVPGNGAGPRDRAAALLVVLVLAASGLWAARDYFVTWAGHPDTPFAFDADKAALAEAAGRATADGAFVYLSPDMAAHPTLRASAAAPPAGIDPPLGHAAPAADGDAATYLYLLPADREVRGELAARLGLDVEEAFTRLDGPFELWRLHLAPLPGFPPAVEGTAPPAGGPRDVGPHVRLAAIGVPEVAHAGDEVTARLVWDVRAPTDRPLHTAVQLVSADGRGLGQGDRPPLGDGHPTSRWRPGERLVADHRIDVAPDAAPGDAILRVGWYAPPLGHAPLEPLVLEDGATVVEVGRIEIRP